MNSATDREGAAARLTLGELEDMRATAFADDVPIEPGMTLWPPQAVAAHFESPPMMITTPSPPMPPPSPPRPQSPPLPPANAWEAARVPRRPPPLAGLAMRRCRSSPADVLNVDVFGVPSGLQSGLLNIDELAPLPLVRMTSGG